MYELIRELADDGAAILLISSELEGYTNSAILPEQIRRCHFRKRQIAHLNEVKEQILNSRLTGTDFHPPLTQKLIGIWYAVTFRQRPVAAVSPELLS